jgi:hypothetical protein
MLEAFFEEKEQGRERAAKKRTGSEMKNRRTDRNICPECLSHLSSD